MGRTLPAIALASTLAFGGCLGNEKIVEKPEPPVREEIMSSKYVKANYFIEDTDRDGQADFLGYNGSWIFVASDFRDSTNQGLRVMDPELRKVTTNAMNASKELYYLLELRFYEKSISKSDTSRK